jgi:hypothetical protein
LPYAGRLVVFVVTVVQRELHARREVRRMLHKDVAAESADTAADHHTVPEDTS